MMFPRDERLRRLRQLARQLEATPASPLRDELLGQTRARIVELEAPADFDPPSPIASVDLSAKQS